jgi:hypothetical protein
MINYLLIYLTGGIIFNLAGPLAVQIRREMADLRLQTVPVEHVLLRRRKLLISELVFRTLVLILYPVAYAMWFADLYRDRKNSATRIVRQEKARREIEAEKEKRKRALLEHRNFVYFNENQGGGTIKCHGCGFREDIVSYIHGARRPFTRGFQCQKCGKFHQIQIIGSKTITPWLKCACGGELSNIRPLFCPRCKARDVYYAGEYAL